MSIQYDIPFQKRKRLFLKRLYRCRALYLMVLPSMIALVIFYFIPLYGVQIAFKDFRSSLGIWGSPWVGLKHFKNFLNYPYFTRLVWNTLRINLLVFSTFPIPIIFSLMLNEMRDGILKKSLQMISYAPHFVSVVVACSMATLFLARDGLIGNLIAFFGGEPMNLLAIPSAFAPIYLVLGNWQGLGWSTIIYLATLSGVSPELIEAAKIDGANRLQVIWHIHLPHLKPTVVVLLILELGSLLSLGFEKVLLLQNPLNLETSSVIATYSYEVGINGAQFSYSTAIGLFNNVVNIVIIVLANKISKKVAKMGMW